MLRKKAGFVGLILLVVLLCTFFYFVGKGNMTGRVKKVTALRAINLIERKQTWDEQLTLIVTELSYQKDWFDTIEILSTWLYQNTRTGNPDLYVARKISKDLNGWIDTIRTHDAKWFYEINISDSVVSFCAEHAEFATRLYVYFGIKSFNLSIRSNPTNAVSSGGHMINVIQNSNNGKWYLVDHFFGIRWRFNGEPLDIKTFFKLSKTDLHLIDVETFGVYKIHVQRTPEAVVWDCCYNPIEVVFVEPANYSNYYRIAAPFTLRKTFPLYKSLFDSIAASYNQPPHVDWIDLARRMPMYGTRLFSTLNSQEQSYADSLLSSWKQ